MKIKKRLDHAIQELYPTLSKMRIQSLIMQGKVTVNERIETKAGTQIKPDDRLHLDLEEPKYVSRAGFKLEGALDHFGIDPEGKVALDAGLSTGGFSDCLLQRGIAKIYGIDVGYGQVHEKVAKDPRLVNMERTNLRTIETLPELVDIVTLDLSFISLLKVIETVARLMKPHAQLIALIKPQFEARKDQIGKGGIVKDNAVHQEVIDKVVAGIGAHGFEHKGTIESPILGGEGNKEFLAYFIKK